MKSEWRSFVDGGKKLFVAEGEGKATFINGKY